MAITVINRPVGYKLDTTPVSATVTNDGGDALFTAPGHGLSEANIYIESNIDTYNGFGFVASGYGFSTFKVEKDGYFLPFIQNADVIYYFERLTHAWQCVHLPIVYELESDLYPTNTDDTVISITPFGSVNGYFAVSHAALTGGDVLVALDYVKLNDGRIIQVVEIVSSTQTVLNFDGSGTIATMQKVRNNYHVLVNVFAGLPIGHPWESEKPYELASTLRFIPDSNNRIKFSIAEILKGYINTRNNLTLDTLPNNIDFMTAFYIEFAEAYDVSSGTEITVFETEFEEDDFEGYAVNAMLPFKNLYSGFMSEYVDAPAPGELARWLTTMDTPLIFVGYFFDLSFINRHDGDVKINKNGVLYLTIPDPGIGVLRVPIEAEAGDTELCIQAWIGTGITEYNIDVFTGGEDWSIGGGASVTLEPLESSSTLSQAIVKQAGIYTISYTINVSGAEADGVFQIRFKKAGDTVGTFTDTASVGSPSGSGPITITDTADELTFVIVNGSGSGLDTTYELTELSITGEDYITESICLRVVSECDTFIADDLRLIETGPFRELE